MELHPWLKMVETLATSPDWPATELPIERVQTHISVVLLGREHVLKLKKPLAFRFLDYTTLDKRRRACEAELELNRRLCPGVYLEVRPIFEVGGRASLQGEGRVIDHGVWMRRLPAECMLDRLVADDAVTEAMIESVADRMSAFHRAARRGPDVDVHASPEAIRRNWSESFDETAPHVGRTIPAAAHSAIRRRVDSWLAGLEPQFQRRVHGGHVCDGHGDLRCESICITNGLCIFDCIEFDERFRCADVACEIAFLAMDLDARGRPDLGYAFAEVYQTRTGDGELRSLLPFYRCYRAYVRGKVLSLGLDEPGFSAIEQQRARSLATSYFDLAWRYATPLEHPTAIGMMGLSGTGKTAVARAIAGELGFRVVSSDAIRRELFAGAPHYDAEADRLTYRTLLERGSAVLEQDRGVVLDATFQRAADREPARAMAARQGAGWRSIECRLAPELVRERLARRAERKEGLSEATWETYLLQRAKFEPPVEQHDADHLVIDTGGGLSGTGRAACDWLRRRDRPWD